MAATTCRTHTQSGLELVCEHIAAAVDQASKLPAIACYVEAEHPGEKWFCRTCVHTRLLPVPARPISDEESQSSAFETVTVCGRCFAAAIRRTW